MVNHVAGYLRESPSVVYLTDANDYSQQHPTTSVVLVQQLTCM